MGDVHPHPAKAELARELSRITFERWTSGKAQGKTIFCNSGFEAVEAALKTATLATGKPGVIAFSGGYHGLGYGALNVTHRDYFRAPFRSQLAHFGHFLSFSGESEALGCSDSTFPLSLALSLGERETSLPIADRTTLDDLAPQIRQLCARHQIGAILVEPVQGRGGIRVPPAGFLALLRKTCDELNLLLICDEIFTGFGRTGRWFACEHSSVIPDLICLGKALTGGFPLSACVGNSRLMDDAWPRSTGEAIHTSTFLGHPVGCAMALAQIKEIDARKLVARSATLGARLLTLFRKMTLRSGLVCEIRGVGLMVGFELRHPDGSPATGEVLSIIKQMLARGFILLPEGEHSNVISFTPPLTISEAQLSRCVAALEKVL